MLSRFSFLFLIAGLLPSGLHAQSASQPAPMPAQQTTVVVLGEAEPVPVTESTHSVEVLPAEGQPALAVEPAELLRGDASLYLAERGSGAQGADVQMRGGSFQQTLVLVNGLRMNDAQTGHHNLDLPIPLDAMQSVEVLSGAGSALHGADAMAGVIDFETVAPASDQLRLRLGQGNWGGSEAAMVAGLAGRRASARLTAGRESSDGFAADRDYENRSSSLESWLATPLGSTGLMLAVSDRQFGADQFYSPYPSWERTKGWFGAVRQPLGTCTQAAFGYRRHSDEFILIRGNPAIYENNHIDRSWQAELKRAEPVGQGAVVLAGLAADGDSIRSTNLGDHARNRGAGFLDLDLHPSARRWRLSAGVRGEIFSGGREVYSPQLAGSVRLGGGWKLRASGGYGFRLPTYTDLYYQDPATSGDANLKPESAWSGEAGAEWARGSRLLASVTGFLTREHDAIDYVRQSAAGKWQAANLSGMRYRGVEARVEWLPAAGERVQVGWTAIDGAQAALHGLESRYVSNYPVENVTVNWVVALGRQLALRNTLESARRSGHGAYAVWNLALERETGRLRPYLRLTNGTNTAYEEIDAVRMSGRGLMGGMQLVLGR